MPQKKKDATTMSVELLRCDLAGRATASGATSYGTRHKGSGLLCQIIAADNCIMETCADLTSMDGHMNFHAPTRRRQYPQRRTISGRQSLPLAQRKK